MKFNFRYNFLYLSLVLIISHKIINSKFQGLQRIISLDDPLSSEVNVSNSMKNLIIWTRHSGYPLFVVPPEGVLFESFRYFSKKSIWGRVPDINQLAYSPQYYLEGMARLKKLGFEAKKRHDFIFKYNLCYLVGQRDFDYLPIVLDTGNSQCLSKYNVLFRNHDFLVVQKK